MPYALRSQTAKGKSGQEAESPPPSPKPGPSKARPTAKPKKEKKKKTEGEETEPPAPGNSGGPPKGKKGGKGAKKKKGAEGSADGPPPAPKAPKAPKNKKEVKPPPALLPRRGSRPRRAAAQVCHQKLLGGNRGERGARRAGSPAQIRVRVASPADEKVLVPPPRRSSVLQLAVPSRRSGFSRFSGLSRRSSIRAYSRYSRRAVKDQEFVVSIQPAVEAGRAESDEDSDEAFKKRMNEEDEARKAEGKRQQIQALNAALKAMEQERARSAQNALAEEKEKARGVGPEAGSQDPRNITIRKIRAKVLGQEAMAISLKAIPKKPEVKSEEDPALRRPEGFQPLKPVLNPSSRTAPTSDTKAADEIPSPATALRYREEAEERRRMSDKFRKFRETRELCRRDFQQWDHTFAKKLKEKERALAEAVAAAVPEFDIERMDEAPSVPALEPAEPLAAEEPPAMEDVPQPETRNRRSPGETNFWSFTSIYRLIKKQ